MKFNNKLSWTKKVDDIHENMKSQTNLTQLKSRAGVEFEAFIYLFFSAVVSFSEKTKIETNNGNKLRSNVIS